MFHFQTSTNMAEVTIKNCTIFISYSTAVGMRYYDGEKMVYIRIDSPSKTTTKHMKSMGIYEWEVVNSLEDHLNKVFK